MPMYTLFMTSPLMVMDAELLRVQVGLTQVESGANVLIASAAYDVVFDRSQDHDGFTIVPPSQAVVDLMSGSGRSPADCGWLKCQVPADSRLKGFELATPLEVEHRICALLQEVDKTGSGGFTTSKRPTSDQCCL